MTPVSLTIARLRIRRTVQLRLSAESGFWNTICTARRSSAVRSPVLPSTTLPSMLQLATRIGRVDAEHRLGQRRLAGTRLTDETERLALLEADVDADERRHVVAVLAERLRHVADLEHDAVAGGRLDPLGVFGSQDLADPVGVMAPGPSSRTDLDHRGHLGPADLGGERAAVDEHARRQRRADLGQRAGDRRQQALALADAVAREAAEQADRVGMLGIVEHLLGGALLDDLAGVHHADPVAHRADHAEVVGDQQDRRVGVRPQGAHEIEHLGLDGGVETGGRLVEHEQLRVAGERHGDHDPLLHPARELVRIPLHDPHRVGDANAAQRVECVRLRLVVRTVRAA